jgi:hypothetical protein
MKIKYLLIMMILFFNNTIISNTSNNIYTSANKNTTTDLNKKRSLGFLLYDTTSTSPLGANEEYNSGPINVAEFSLITLTLKGSPSNATGNLFIEFSPDGTNWDHIIKIPVSNLSEEPPHTITPVSIYCRIRYINNSTEQENFRLQAVFHRNASKGLTSRLEQQINNTTDVDNVRAVIVGRNEAGKYNNVNITSANALAVDIKGATSAFGEVAVSEPTTISQIQFTYGINPALITPYTNNGATINENHGLATLSTGSNNNSFATLISNLPIKYNPGQGAFCRFSGVFSSGLEGSEQYIGVGDTGNGFFFGYKGSQFGILRRTGGSPEIRTLTISKEATKNQHIDLILDSTTVTVPVTAQNHPTETANEIAAFNYSNVGPGWRSIAVGNQVLFIAYDAVPRNGIYSLTATKNPENRGPVGNFEQTISGKMPTEFFTPQSEWNIDKYDGTGSSNITLDPTKGNVYQIRWQWLGFGAIGYFIENPETGSLEKVHIERYANKNNTTSVRDPNLPLHYSVRNTSNNSNITIKSGSIAGFIDGKDIPFGIRQGAVGSKIIDQNITPILTVRNSLIYNGKQNNSRAKINFAFAGSNHSEPIELLFYANATLTGANFSPVSPISFMQKDTSALQLQKGTLIATDYISPKSNFKIELSQDQTAGIMPPGSSFTIAARSIGKKRRGKVTASFNFIELK